jgi:glutaredoxin 2
MGTDVLRELGFSAYTATRAAKTYRKNDEAYVRKMADHRHDHASYIHTARESIRALDELMRADAVPVLGDDGWTPPVAGNSSRGESK